MPRRSAKLPGKDAPNWTFYPAHDAPTALDVVWCRFPFVEDLNNPAPKARPGLVRRVVRKEGQLFVEVSFGTSNRKKYSDHDLYIANLQDMIDAGLPQATVFVLDRTAVIPWAKEWCAKREDGTGPVVGRLNARCREYLRHILSHGNF